VAKQPSTAPFATILWWLRRKSGLTHEQLAEKADCHPSTLSLLETEKRGPSLEMVLKLSRALGYSAADVVGEVEKEVERLGSVKLRTAITDEEKSC